MQERKAHDSQQFAVATKPQPPLKSSLRERASAMATMLADSLLVAVWAISTWGVERLLSELNLSGATENITLQVFKWVFAISTLIPVLAYTITDITEIVRDTTRKLNGK